MEESKEKYPWLDKNDERKYMTDREILDRYINLDNLWLTDKGKTDLIDLLYEYKDTFSLKDKIGTCPNIEVDMYIMNKIPFFIRLYHGKEEDKNTLDKERKKICYLGILKEGFSAYSSPLMLISRKMMQDKRAVTDFRHLNMQIAKNNLAHPLLKDTFMLLGSSKCEVLSVLDLKDAFHSHSLSGNSKMYCGILLYSGSASYLYQRMLMGLNISPAIWQSYINAILDCLQSRRYCEAIKCHLFKTELQYMGNTIFIKGKRFCVRPLCSRMEAIQKPKPLTTIKGCEGFAVMVNFVCIFCLELQKLLKPIYDLTRKGRQFIWGQEQQTTFNKIKNRLQKSPLLPDKKGRFQLYSNTSKLATGSVLY